MARNSPAAAGTFTRTVLVILAIAALAFGVYQALFPKRSQPGVGPLFQANGTQWQSRHLDWIELDGKHAVDMIIAPVSDSDPPARVVTIKLDHDFLLSWCRGFLAEVRPEHLHGVQRKDIYRLGFQFVQSTNRELSEPLPVAVVDGTCEITLHEGQYYWNYPNDLAGWSPVGLKARNRDGGTYFTIEFLKIKQNAIDLDAFDPLLACKALFTDMPPNIATEIRKPKAVRIKAISRVGNSLLNFARTRIWDVSVDGKTCEFASTDEP